MQKMSTKKLERPPSFPGGGVMAIGGLRTISL